jgi:hypothetical protein
MGALLCSVLMFFRVIQCPVILLAPPFPNVIRPLWAAHLASGKSITVVHAMRDPMSSFATAMGYCHRNLRQLVVDDEHALRKLLADDGLLSIIAVAITCRQMRPTNVTNCPPPVSEFRT